MKNRITVGISLMTVLTIGLFVEALALLVYPIYPFAFLSFSLTILSGICTSIFYKNNK